MSDNGNHYSAQPAADQLWRKVLDEVGVESNARRPSSSRLSSRDQALLDRILEAIDERSDDRVVDLLRQINEAMRERRDDDGAAPPGAPETLQDIQQRLAQLSEQIGKQEAKFDSLSQREPPVDAGPRLDADALGAAVTEALERRLGEIDAKQEQRLRELLETVQQRDDNETDGDALGEIRKTLDALASRQEANADSANSAALEEIRKAIGESRGDDQTAMLERILAAVEQRGSERESTDGANDNAALLQDVLTEVRALREHREAESDGAATGTGPATELLEQIREKIDALAEARPAGDGDAEQPGQGHTSAANAETNAKLDELLAALQTVTDNGQTAVLQRIAERLDELETQGETGGDGETAQASSDDRIGELLDEVRTLREKTDAALSARPEAAPTTDDAPSPAMQDEVLGAILEELHARPQPTDYAPRFDELLEQMKHVGSADDRLDDRFTALNDSMRSLRDEGNEQLLKTILGEMRVPLDETRQRIEESQEQTRQQLGGLNERLDSIAEGQSTLSPKLDALSETNAGLSAQVEALLAALREKAEAEAAEGDTDAAPLTEKLEHVEQRLTALAEDRHLHDKLDGLLEIVQLQDSDNRDAMQSRILEAVQRLPVAQLSEKLDQLLDSLQHRPAADPALGERLEQIDRRLAALPVGEELQAKLDGLIEKLTADAAQSDDAHGAAAKLDAILAAVETARDSNGVAAIVENLREHVDAQSNALLDAVAVDRDAITQHAAAERDAFKAHVESSVGELRQSVEAAMQSLQQSIDQRPADAADDGDARAEQMELLRAILEHVQQRDGNAHTNANGGVDRAQIDELTAAVTKLTAAAAQADGKVAGVGGVSATTNAKVTEALKGVLDSLRGNREALDTLAKRVDQLATVKVAEADRPSYGYSYGGGWGDFGSSGGKKLAFAAIAAAIFIMLGLTVWNTVQLSNERDRAAGDGALAANNENGGEPNGDEPNDSNASPSKDTSRTASNTAKDAATINGKDSNAAAKNKLAGDVKDGEFNLFPKDDRHDAPTNAGEVQPIALEDARSVVFLLHAEDPALLPALVAELRAAMQRLKPDQKFSVLFTDGSSAVEALTVGQLKPATDQLKQALDDWLVAEAATIRPAINPQLALVRSMNYDSDLLWIHCDELTGDDEGEMKAQPLAKLIASLNPKRSVHVNITQHTSRRDDAVLRAISDQHGGEYHYVPSSTSLP